MESLIAEPLKSWAQVASSLGTLAAVIAGGIWFIRTTKYRQRIQFDLSCTTLPILKCPDALVMEIQFILENKGFIEHRIFDLRVSVHALEPDTELTTKAESGELRFTKRLLPETQIVPPATGYFFVRPGVRQIITHIISIPSTASPIRITAGFRYVSHARDPHTARRVFSTATANQPR